MSRGGRRLALAVVVILAGCNGGDGRDARRAEGATPRPGGGSVCYEAPRSGPGGPVTFSDATRAVGLEEPFAGMFAHAVATGDVNADGWDDVFVGTFADRPVEEYRVRGASGPAPDRLLLGGPRGFRPDPTFPGEHGRTSGAAFADLDGDGDLDLVVSRNYRDAERARAPSSVLRNNGGRFTVARELDDRRGARSVGVLDYDADGKLDIVLVEDRFSGGSTVVLHNDGELRFSDATARAGLPRDVHGLGVVAADLSGDGRGDLFVAGSNRLFVNAGGTFREAPSDVFKWERYGDEDDVAGVAAGDVNRDGRPDLVLGQHYNSTIDEGRRVPVRLYLNEGTTANGVPGFRDVTREAGLVGLPTKAPHVEIVDLDADGWPDVLTSASAGAGTRPAVFRHLGLDGAVPRFDPPEGTGHARYWVAGATLDVDRDGRVDVLLADFEPDPGSRLLRNETDTGHWVGVTVGPAGAGGVGATVSVYPAGARGVPSRLLGSREISASTGYGSGSLPVARFGLGRVTSVDVVVRAEGRQATVLAGQPVDRLVEIVGTRPCSPSGAPAALAATQRS